MTEGRGQMTEDRRRKTDNRRQRLLIWELGFRISDCMPIALRLFLFSTFRIPNSEFKYLFPLFFFPHSAFRIPHSILSPQPTPSL
jgi:hypothetical protein